MTDNQKAQQAAHGRSYQNPELGAGLIDVLMRGLDLARRNLKEGDTAEPREFCAFAYGTPGTFCPIAYWHRT